MNFALEKALMAAIAGKRERPATSRDAEDTRGADHQVGVEFDGTDEAS